MVAINRRRERKYITVPAQRVNNFAEIIVVDSKLDYVGGKQENCARKNARYSGSIKGGRLMKIEVTDIY